MITIHNSIIPPSRHIPAPWIVLASILGDMSGQLAEQAHCSKCAAFAFCLMLTVHITQPFRGSNASAAAGAPLVFNRLSSRLSRNDKCCTAVQARTTPVSAVVGGISSTASYAKGLWDRLNGGGRRAVPGTAGLELPYQLPVPIDTRAQRAAAIAQLSRAIDALEQKLQEASKVCPIWSHLTPFLKGSQDVRPAAVLLPYSAKLAALVRALIEGAPRRPVDCPK